MSHPYDLGLIQRREEELKLKLAGKALESALREISDNLVSDRMYSARMSESDSNHPCIARTITDRLPGYTFCGRLINLMGDEKILGITQARQMNGGRCLKCVHQARIEGILPHRK